LSIEIQSLSTEKANDNIKSLRNVLAREGQRINASHDDLKALHVAGYRSMRIVYLKDGTMLGDMGGSTLAIHPDNRLAVLSNSNPDKVRAVMTQIDSAGDIIHFDFPQLASYEGHIVLDAHQRDELGVSPDWAPHSVNQHDNLISEGNADFGIIKHIDDDTWRSEALEYEVKPLSEKQKIQYGSDAENKAVLFCGYGVGIAAEKAEKDQKFLKWLWKTRRRLNRDHIIASKSDIENIVVEHASKVLPRILEGFDPHETTFETGFESKFSESIIKRHFGFYKKIVNHQLTKLIPPHLVYHGVELGNQSLIKGKILISVGLGAAALLASGIYNTIGKTLKTNVLTSLPKAAGTFFIKGGAVRMWAVIPAFMVTLFPKVINSAKAATQKWTNKDTKNISASFYEEKKDAKVRERLYQKLDPKEVSLMKLVSDDEHPFRPADAKIYDEIPEFYSLNRLFNTKSNGAGTEMDGFKINSNEVAYYREKNGMEQISIHRLRVVYITAMDCSIEDELDLAHQTKEILFQDDVIRIVEGADRQLSQKPMSYDEFEQDIQEVTREFKANTRLTHPNHAKYMEEQEALAAQTKLGKAKTTFGKAKAKIDGLLKRGVS